MKKILVSILLVLMVLALAAPVSAEDPVGCSVENGHVACIGDVGYTTLDDAIEEYTGENEIVLLDDYDVNATIKATKSFSLNLNGKTLNGAEDVNPILLMQNDVEVKISNGTVESKNHTAGANDVIVNDGKLTFDHVTLNVYETNSLDKYRYAVRVQAKEGGNGEPVFIMENSTINEIDDQNVSDDETYGVVGIAVLGSTNTAAVDGTNTPISAKVSINQSKVTTSGYCVSGNGQTHGTEIVLNEAELSSRKSTAIYHPQYGTMSVDRSMISGLNAGIEVRSGEVSTSNSTIESTSNNYEGNANGNGTTTKGVGLVVVQHTTGLPISVEINDGTVIKGIKGLEENNLQNNPPVTTEEIIITVNGGTFESTSPTNEYSSAIDVEDVKQIEINGGTFSDLSPLEEVINQDGYSNDSQASINIKLNSYMRVQNAVEIPENISLDLDLNGKTLSTEGGKPTITNKGSLTVRNSVPGQGGLDAYIDNNKDASVNIVDNAISTDKIKGEGKVSHITTQEKPSRPTYRPSSPSKDLPSNTKECQKEFGDEYIWSDEYDACVIKFMIVDTSTR